MPFAKRLKLPKTLAFRLTLWYGLIFSLLFALAFFFFYMLISHELLQRLDNRLSEKISEFEAIYNLQGIEDVRTAALAESQAAGEEKVFFRLLYASGVAFSSSNMTYWREIGINRDAVDRLLEGGSRVYETLKLPGRDDRVRIVYGLIGRGVAAQIGYTMENDTAFIGVFKKIFLLAMTALIVTAVWVGWFMARRALSGVEAVTRTAQQISESDLSRRVPVPERHEEVVRLAVTFNQMLDRIEKLITGIREMGDNIAHDLKSPITRIRGMAEVSLSGGAGSINDEMLAGSTVEECDRLLDMINTMLLISKTNAGVGDMEIVSIDLADEIRRAVALFQPLVEDKGLSMTFETPDVLRVTGDLKMLQRAITNLLDNAVNYTPAPGDIEICLWREKEDSGRFHLSIKDSGVGIHKDDLPRIFDRFFRCDQSRAIGGAGLGLSLARAIAMAHGGDIQVTSTLGKGSCFTLSLPNSILDERLN